MIDVVLVILQNQNRFLLIRHSPEGTWAYPSGEREPEDQCLIATAHRKLLEEIGIDGNNFHLLFQTPIDECRLNICVCLEWIGQPHGNIVEIGWFTLEEMYAMQENLSPDVNILLPELAYFTQHYKAHPDERK